MDLDATNELLDLFDETYEEPADRQSIVRAPFGIPGTKTRSISYLKKHIPVRNKWVDCFCGSGIVTFNRAVSPILEVMNDRYGGIVAFYRCLQDANKWQQMRDWLENAQTSREEFYNHKLTWCSETDDVIRAAKWFYMLRASVIGKGDCFARTTNSKHGFPVAASIKGFFPIHVRLKKVLIENLDFETCTKDFDSVDCVQYFDPPYVGTDPGVYDTKWTRDDLSRLLRTIGNSHSFCAMSGYDDNQISSESFWTDKITWEMPANAEVKAFLSENYKEKHKNVQNVDYVTECLWIKE